MGSESFLWPPEPLSTSISWSSAGQGAGFARSIRERLETLRVDSRWPAFFPSAIAFATTHDAFGVAMERIVGPTIVNRFPYVMAISVCRADLSKRHHARRTFMSTLERSGNIALQFFTPGPSLDRVLSAGEDVPEMRTGSRVAYTGLSTRRAFSHDAPVFAQAYLVYEGTLASPARDGLGGELYSSPWTDVGSHRIYFFEIRAIQLRRDVADGRSQVRWQSLPDWRPLTPLPAVTSGSQPPSRFVKPYTPYYVFPSASTVPFVADERGGGMAIKWLPSAASQVERDNDLARWPCFFPSSAGIITTWYEDGVPNLMPCGSTAVVSRHPFVIAPCVSYAAINDRYAPRATLDTIRRTGRFGCGVPFVHDSVVTAIRYAGNTSIREDRSKAGHAGLQICDGDGVPILPGLPINFECEVTSEIRLGTHAMFLGVVRGIRVRSDVTPHNPVRWVPWAQLAPAKDLIASESTLAIPA